MTVDPEEWKDLYSPLYLIHATSADLQIHILLSLYDITLPQTIFRLLLHLLSFARLPNHAVIFGFFIIQPVKI